MTTPVDRPWRRAPSTLNLRRLGSRHSIDLLHSSTNGFPTSRLASRTNLSRGLTSSADIRSWDEPSQVARNTAKSSSKCPVAHTPFNSATIATPF